MTELATKTIGQLPATGSVPIDALIPLEIGGQTFHVSAGFLLSTFQSADAAVEKVADLLTSAACIALPVTNPGKLVAVYAALNPADSGYWRKVANAGNAADYVKTDLAWGRAVIAATSQLAACEAAADRAENAASAADTSFTPLRYAPALLLDPGDPSTVFSDLAGTVPAVIGGPVGYIKDKSGNGRHWTAYDNASRPSYVQLTDGRLRVRFAVSSWGMTLPFAAPIAQPFYRLSLIRQIGWTANAIIFDGGVAAEARLVQQFEAPFLSMNAGAVTILNGDAVVGEDSVVEEYFNGANSSLRQGNYVALVGNAGTNSLHQLRIGGIWFGSQTASANHSNFDFGGVVIGAGTLSGYNRLESQRYYRRRRQSFLKTPKVIQCVGHSFAAGTGATTSANRYVNRLATRLGAGWATVNRGVPTQQSHNIACRMDAIPMTVNLVGNGIPAQGAVGVTIASPLATTYSGSQQSQSGPLANMINASLPVTITANDGSMIEGLLSVAGVQGVYSFTRTAAGEPLAVAPGSTMRVLQNTREFDFHILDMCRNNFAEPRVITDIAACVARLGPGAKVIIAGCTNSRGGTEDNGSASLTAINTLNATLAGTYGANFYDRYAYWRNTGVGGAYQDLGKSAAGDAADLALGRIGATWLSAHPDNLHPNNDGHDADSFNLTATIGALAWS